jgi:hypothetical protein
MSVEELVEELSNNPRYSHAVFGRFDDHGHGAHGMIGPVQNLKRYTNNEKEYSELFENPCGQEFIAKVHGENIPEGFKLRLIYNDRQGDSRGASHTDYILLIPSSEISRVVPAIKSEPTIMIRLFQKLFPNYDRSKGALRIDSGKPGNL